MQKSIQNNYAFIDSQNVNLSVRYQGWKINWNKFRVYLKEKMHVTHAYLFIGYVPGNESRYIEFQKAGFICVFKPTVELPDRKVKGNVDAELVLRAMAEKENFDRAIIVSGDGDFYCLAVYLAEHNKLYKLLIPNKNRFSALLKYKVLREYLQYMNDLQEKVS